tara:strand:- start:2840 stop:3820 length:981 start_codon:yes stop_codon:yes gene_type:complete
MTNNERLTVENVVSTGPFLLSIVVAAYNHEDFISDCLYSILECRRIEDVEIIIIDDGSSDKTVSVVEELLSRFDVNFRVFTKPNSGLTDSLAIGLQRAAGKYVSFMASDDAYFPYGLDACLEKLSVLSATDVAILFQGEFFGSATGPVYNQETSHLFMLSKPEFLKAISLEYPKPMLLQSTVFGVEFLRSINPWSDRLGLDDWPTFIRVAQRVAMGVGSFTYDPSITICRYRFHKHGIHANLDRQLKVCLEVVDKVVDPAFRAESRANVYIDRSLNYLSKGRVGISLKLLWRGGRGNPTIGTIFRAPRLVIRKLSRRLVRLYSAQR